MAINGYAWLYMTDIMVTPPQLSFRFIGLCMVALFCIRFAEIIVVLRSMKRMFGEATFLNVSTGWGFQGMSSLGTPTAYSALASMLVCVLHACGFGMGSGICLE